MNAVIHSPASDAPFDYAAIGDVPDWRERLAWPLSYSAQFGLGQSLSQRIVETISKQGDPDLQRIALMAAGSIFASCLPILETCLAVIHQSEQGRRFVGRAPQMSYIQFDKANLPPPNGDATFLAISKPRWIILRRLVRVAEWSSISRIRRAYYQPTAVAISHNPLLRECAKRTDALIGFCHSEVIFANCLSNKIQTSNDWQLLVDKFINALFFGFDFDDSRVVRAIYLATREVEWWLERASNSLAAVRSVQNFPDEIWSGSAGYWPTRAISLEVKRRGGKVRRFDHSGGIGLNTLHHFWQFGEFSLSSVYTVATPELARRVVATGATKNLPVQGTVEIKGAAGDPQLRTMMSIKRMKKGTRQRVLYLPLPLFGFRQVMPPLMPDLISLDWQMRILEMMLEFDMDLSCRPHPEGILKGQRHPLAHIAPVSPQSFEKHIEATDVFVFEYIQSTAFYEALCTDRRIVLIDMGLPIMIGDAREMLERRCRIVRAYYDECNRPHVDRLELAEAILGYGDDGDPSEFWHLLVGDLQ